MKTIFNFRSDGIESLGKSRHFILLSCILLFCLNAFLCRRLFVTEYTAHMDSIEAAYIGLSRYVLDHPFEFGWFPLWYDGIPFQNTYPPLLHALVAVVAWVLGLSPALAHHLTGAMFYSLGPVFLFLLAFRLSNDRLGSWIAALAFSLWSPSIFLDSSTQSWALNIWNPARLQSLVVFGDGPHVSSLTLIPLAILSLDSAVRKPRAIRVYLAAVALAAVVLTNWLGAFALAIAAACYLLANWELFGVRKTAWAALTAVIAYGLAAPWIPPSTINDIRYNAQFVIGRYPITSAHLLYGGIVALCIALLLWVMIRIRVPIAIRFAALFSFLMCVLVLGDDWFDIQLMPQPHRYHLEMELGLCLLLGLLVAPIYRRIQYKQVRMAIATAAALFLISQAVVYNREARSLIQPIDIATTVEYQVSTWLEENRPGERIFTTGSTQFWLNAFSDVPQVGGGFGQGIVNRMIPVIHYGIPWNTEDGMGAITWLQLYGAKAVFVSGAESRDSYAEAWRDPGKFEGLLPVLWQDGDDILYDVPQRSRSLAHVIRPESIVTRSPINVVDFDPVVSLVDDFDDQSLPLASFTWQGPSHATIRSDFTPGQLLFIQVTNHPGWNASVDGQPRAIQGDGLGFMVIDPQCQGECVVELNFDGGTEAILARITLAVTVLLGVFSFYFWDHRPERLRN